MNKTKKQKAMNSKLKNLIVRTVSGVLFVAIMVAGIVGNARSFALLFTLITTLSVWEFTTLMNQREDITINRFIATAAGGYLFLAMLGFCSGLTPPIVFIPYLLTIIYLLVSELYLQQPNPISDWAHTMLAQIYVALPFGCLNVLAFQTDSVSGQTMYNWLLPMSLFAFLWLNDTGAYCVGSLLGKHKLFPRISPAKSWEGSIGGAVVVLIAAGIVGYYENLDHCGTLSLLQWLGFGLTVVVFGTWGDLIESLMKRSLGIKDSGNIMPGHGGMLDRFDSSLLAIPAAVVYLYTITLF